jgi:hypothetical protein
MLVENMDGILINHVAVSAYTSRLGIGNDGAIHFAPGAYFASYGDAQSSIYVLHNTSTANNPVDLRQAVDARFVVNEELVPTFLFRFLL